MITTNIGNSVAYNRMLPEEFTKARLNCRQKCTTGGACQICYRYFSLADKELIKDYAETMNLI
jgi:hypothetical protein